MKYVWYRIEEFCINSWDGLLNCHINRLLWKLPARWHELVLKLTDCRIVAHSGEVGRLPYRWEWSKQFPPNGMHLCHFSSHVDEPIVYPTLIEHIQQTFEYVKKQAGRNPYVSKDD